MKIRVYTAIIRKMFREHTRCFSFLGAIVGKSSVQCCNVYLQHTIQESAPPLYMFSNQNMLLMSFMC